MKGIESPNPLLLLSCPYLLVENSLETSLVYVEIKIAFIVEKCYLYNKAKKYLTEGQCFFLSLIIKGTKKIII